VLRISEARSGADSEVKDLVRALGDVVALVEPRLLELWKSTGITFAQRRLLRRLASGARSAGELASELGVAAPTLTRRLEKLERRGLVSREVDSSDRRRVVVDLTDAGRRLLAGHRVLGGGPLPHAAREMDTDERRALTASLRSLIRLAREEGVGGE
jgi:MarR family transcriptional regulator, organic hydroperoxide resistance regulator